MGAHSRVAGRTGTPGHWTDDFRRGAFQDRLHELERLSGAFSGLRRGEPARLLILGEVGIGKSRLLTEAVALAAPARTAIFGARALEFEMDRPFGVLVDALDLRVGSVDAERASIGRLVLRARDPARAEERHNLVGRIVRLVASLCKAGPVALLLDDMQWADQMSAATVGAILGALPDRPIAVLMAQRWLPLNPAIDDVLERAHPPVELLELGPMPPGAIVALVRDLAGGEPGPGLTKLVAGAGGNPGMVINVLDGLRDAGALTVHAGKAETAATEPPSSLRPVVMARFARLSGRCQDLVTVAAVLGGPFDVATLAAVAGRPGIDVLADLREAMAGRIIGDTDGSLHFRHELVRTILYEETPAATRSTLHSRIREARRVAEADGALHGWETLTKTEREVVRHAVEGLSNRQIGERLFVSARTVETHLSHVFAKLGMRSRVELTGAVVRTERARGALVEEPSSSSRGKSGPI